MLHRRAGKTYFAVMRLLIKALQNTNKRPRYGYFAPEQAQGMDIVWGYLKDFTENLPGCTLRESKRELKLPNGAVIKVFGLSDADSLRGQYFDGVVIDEFSDTKPDDWGTALLPTLTDRKGWAIIMGTPKGDDHFQDILKMAEEDTTGYWYGVRKTVFETNVIDEEEINMLQRTQTEAQFAQEYLCDPYADFSNKYYLELVRRALEDDRICDVPYNPKHAVFTAWDLGRDATSVWFAQKYKGKITLIDYWEKSNSTLEEALNAVMNRGYIFRGHFLPHDATQTRINSTTSIYQRFRDMNLMPVLLKRGGVSEGIAGVQGELARCYFDINKTVQGVTCLSNYQAKIDSKQNIMMDQPKHDKYSHGADAFRYLIQGLGMYPDDDDPKKHEWNKNNGYMNYDEFGDWV